MMISHLDLTKSKFQIKSFVITFLWKADLSEETEWVYGNLN